MTEVNWTPLPVPWAVQAVDRIPKQRYYDEESYAPAEWKDKLWPTGNAASLVPHFYDTPDSYKTMSRRGQRSPFRRQATAGRRRVSIPLLEPMCDAQLPQAEHVLKATHNDWLADVWLGENNWHGRWRGAISVTAHDPHAAAREIERWAIPTWPRC